MIVPLAALVWPGLFYGGIAAASVPILIHLLNKRRFHRVKWAATEFLLEAERRNRRRVRVEEMILLALRCLAMILIGLMLARWFLRPDALMAMLGSAAVNERIVILDDSFSMGTTLQGDAGTVYERGAKAVARLVQWARDETPDDRLTILRTSNPQAPWKSEVRIGDIVLSELQEQLKQLSPSHRAGAMPSAFAAVRALLDARETSVNATVYVVSDFQRLDWKRESDEDSAVDVLAGWSDEKHSLRVVLVDVGEDNVDNLALTALAGDQMQAVTGLSSRYHAGVTRFSERESEATALQLYVGDAALPDAPVPTIAPYQTIKAPIDVTFSQEGSATLTAELPGDRLDADNTRALAVPVARALKVLIVNGEPSADPYLDEVFLLRVALRPEGPQFSGNDLVVIDETEFEQTDPSGFHVVLLANVYRITEGVAERLDHFVRDGGGLIVCLGDQVDPEIYNRMLYRDGAGILPKRLGEMVSAEDRGGVSIGAADATHPVTEGFSGQAALYFDGMRVMDFISTIEDPDTPAGEKVTLTGSEKAEAKSHHTLLTLNDVDQSPLLLERGTGKGRVFLWTTSIDKEWCNLADRPIYLVLIMELIRHAARQDMGGANLLVGEPLSVPLDPSRFQPFAVLKPPGFPAEPSVRLDAQPNVELGMPAITWAGTNEPGVYRVELTETAGGVVTQNVSVNVDTRESDLRRASKSELLSAMGTVPAEYVRGEEVLGVSEAKARKELWPTMLVLLMMVLMLEQGLAWWFGSEQRMARAARSLA